MNIILAHRSSAFLSAATPMAVPTMNAMVDLIEQRPIGNSLFGVPALDVCGPHLAWSFIRDSHASQANRTVTLGRYTNERPPRVCRGGVPLSLAC